MQKIINGMAIAKGVVSLYVLLDLVVMFSLEKMPLLMVLNQKL